MWQALREGGPYHVRGYLAEYADRLGATGRAEYAEESEQIHRHFDP